MMPQLCVFLEALKQVNWFARFISTF